MSMTHRPKHAGLLLQWQTPVMLAHSDLHKQAQSLGLYKTKPIFLYNAPFSKCNKSYLQAHIRLQMHNGYYCMFSLMNVNNTECQIP